MLTSAKLVDIDKEPENMTTSQFTAELAELIYA